MNKKHIAGYTATALVALGIGAAGGSGSAGSTAAAPASVTTTVVSATPGPVTTETVTAGPTKTVTAAASPPAVAMAGDGIYEVGVDVKPGKYIAKPADSGNCYWARLSGPDTGNDILDNGNSAGQVVVTIRKSDKYVEVSGCNDWTRR